MLRRVGRTIGAFVEPTSEAASGFWSLDEVRKFMQESKWPMGTKGTGGTVTQDGDYTIHTFTSDGSFDLISVGSYGIDVLVVAGGGAGGGGRGGGGGGGGVLYYTRSNQIPVGTYAITIGSGGTSVTSNARSNGSNTTFGSLLTAVGGGGGGTHSGSFKNGGAGGSGGGGSINFTGTRPLGGAGTSGQGFAGGNSGPNGDNPRNTGGGGGASEAGTTGSGTTVTPAGGDGRQIDISGTATYYGGGGGGSHGGSDRSTAGRGLGGQGGGGNGQDYSNAGTAGTANTGGGGGGGLSASYTGGSGIVIVRYKRYTDGEGTLANPFRSPVEAQTAGATSGTSYYFQSDTMREPRQLEYQDNYFDGKPWVKVFSSPYNSTATVNEIDYYIPLDGLLVERSTQDIRGGGYVTTSIGRKTYNTNTTGWTGMDMSSANTSTFGGKVMLGGAGAHGFYGTQQNACSWSNSDGGVGAGWDGSSCGSFPNGLRWGTGVSGAVPYTNRSGTWHHWVYWT